MGKIKMVSLFRCSSAERRIMEKEIHFFVTDYFDGIKVESLNLEKTTLAECLGIKHSANAEKQGVSHQRYCLFDNDDGDEDIFEAVGEMPLLTVIQVFINPDIYQASCFVGGEEISCDQCMKKISACMEREFSGRKGFRWKFYRLLTDGDFAIIVRSRRVHDAYDVSTLVRNTFLHVEGMQKDVSAFLTYSISGVLDRGIEEKGICENINWKDYLDESDRAIVRICYSQKFPDIFLDKENRAMKAKFLSFGNRLFGEYDYQVECTPNEFQEIYPFIRDFKFKKEQSFQALDISAMCEKSQILLWMMKEGFISRINEKLLLHYENDHLLTEHPWNIWRLDCEHEWKTLYDLNNKKIIEVRKLAQETETLLRRMYQSARNLKEYVRLLGRLCRILYEINQMQEQRVSVANLLKQLDIMLRSMNGYIKNREALGSSEKEIANRVEAFLHIGIIALENFTKYLRNINLQTLQAPNYDLQTNVCAEKVFLAYSQFLRPFMEKQNGISGEDVYYINETLYPIIVPDMGVIAFSVSVLFNDCQAADRGTGKPEKLMVVRSPTFSYLCETCFLIPTAFHEIAHQFRYENREIRNECIEKYIFKVFLLYILSDILNEKQESRMLSEIMVEDIAETAYAYMESELLPETEKTDNFQYFIHKLSTTLQKLCVAAGEIEDEPFEVVKKYIERTKSSVLDYNMEILSAIDFILEKLEKLETVLENGYKGEKEARDELLAAFYQYKALQEKQIIEAVTRLLEEIKENYGKNMEEGLSGLISSFCEEERTERGLEECGNLLFQIWDKVKDGISDEERADLKNLLKQFHNIHCAYIESEGKLTTRGGRRDKAYYKVISGLSGILYDSILENLQKFEIDRENNLKWDNSLISSSEIEYLRKRLAIEKKEGLEERLKNSLYFQRGLVDSLVNSKIEIYREVTSDLFMCSIMGLNSFGYLVVVAENFVFTEDNRGALYERVSMVLQCLCKKRDGEKLDAEEYEQNLMDTLVGEVDKLLKGNKETQAVCGFDSLVGKDIETVKKALADLRKMETLTSTQDWILRICQQIAVIVKNLRNIRICSQVIGEKDIWKDIVSEASYIQNKDKLQKILEQNDEVGLCKSISDILNSPTAYFKNRKSITLEEVHFILLQYEKNCRSIMQ